MQTVTNKSQTLAVYKICHLFKKYIFYKLLNYCHHNSRVMTLIQYFNYNPLLQGVLSAPTPPLNSYSQNQIILSTFSTLTVTNCVKIMDFGL